MFEGSDVDEHDRDAIALVAVDSDTGEVVGAVRCYPEDDQVWYGGRLAVLKAYRKHAASIGSNLCRLAEETVVAHGCRQLLAYIQTQNVPFFLRLGWRPLGEPVLHHGQPHQLMEASLTALQTDTPRVDLQQVAHG